MESIFIQITVQIHCPILIPQLSYTLPLWVTDPNEEEKASGKVLAECKLPHGTHQAMLLIHIEFLAWPSVLSILGPSRNNDRYYLHLHNQPTQTILETLKMQT
jgi:hypothetical protein